MNLRLFAYSSTAVIAACAFSYLFLDVPVALYFSSIKGPVKEFFAAITYLGESTVYLVVSGIAAGWFRYFVKKPAFSNMALFVFISIAGSGALNAVFKYIFGRGRPGLLADYGLYGFDFFSTGYDYSSFPSGHANTVAALTLSLYLIFGRGWYAYVVIAILPAMSRFVIGAHFLSDVIFGSYLGILTTLLLKRIFEHKGLWPARARGLPPNPGQDRP